MLREAEVVDVVSGRNRVRVVYDGDRVYLETSGNHDGTSVRTLVVIERGRFEAMVRELGVMS